MERIWTTDLSSHDGERVRLAGWLHHMRRLSTVSFLILRDGKGLAQVVVDDPALVDRLAQLPHESVLAVEGTVRRVPQAPGGVEVHEPRVEVISPASAPPPVELYRPTIKAQLPAILDHAPVTLRHPRQRAKFQVAAASMAGVRAVLQARDFVEIQTPKIVGAASEGGANVFTIDYMGRPAYLSQSPQLYKQIMVGVFERVFEIGPAFRAEPHDTPRHLNEFVSLDVEMGFIRDHTTVMEVLADTLRGMLEAIGEQAANAVKLLKAALPQVPPVIPSVAFGEALDLIARETGEDVREEKDLAPAHERWLGEWARREWGSDLLYVTGFPTRTKPFYTFPDPLQPDRSHSFDLLFRGVELVSGGQRLHRYEDYVAALTARGMNVAAFAGYLEAFKHGMPPHGGFAIGLERWVARLIGAANVRETTLFPRDLHRLSP